MSTVRKIGPFRYSGVIESSYLIDEITVEIIVDGAHLPPSLLKLIYKIKGADKICLITDSMRAAGMPEGWSNPSPDENWMFGYPQEIQDFMEAIANDREPKSGMLAASDIVGVLYAAYLSAERRGTEVEIPLLVKF